MSVQNHNSSHSASLLDVIFFSFLMAACSQEGVLFVLVLVSAYFRYCVIQGFLCSIVGIFESIAYIPKGKILRNNKNLPRS